MTKKETRLRKMEEKLQPEHSGPCFRIIWEDVENSSPDDILYDEDGRPITRAEHDRLVREGKIKVIEWSDGD